jgi:hypothetical protein
MKTIRFYEHLTAQERVIATCEALKRNDEGEVALLKRTCPRKTYSQLDSAYVDVMESIMCAGIATEYDLLVQATLFEKTGDAKHLVTLQTIHRAWQLVLGRINVDEVAILNSGLPRLPNVVALLALPHLVLDEGRVLELAELFSGVFD